MGTGARSGLEQERGGAKRGRGSGGGLWRSGGRGYGSGYVEYSF